MPDSRLVHHFLEDSARIYPEKDAVFFNDQWISYGYLNGESNRLAHLLSRAGIGRGDRVAILLQNSVDYVVSYYAILKAGGITVALNTENRSESLRYLIDDCRFRILISQPRLFDRVMDVCLEHGTIEKVLLWQAESDTDHGNGKIGFLPSASSSESTDNPSGGEIDLDTASIVYTSGSTGKPRGVTLSHLNIVSNTRSIVQYLELTETDRVMVVLPFYYIYGKSLLNTHFSVHGSAVIDNRFLYPNVVLKTMNEQKATGFSGVPSTFTILLSRSNVRKIRFDKLRYVTLTGGPMAPAVQKEVAAVFAPAKLFVMYGATEAAARLSYLSPRDLPRPRTESQSR